mmetsp:Transcript_36877/g.73548  ORF Transcript_36877/g.73548 Transcript_36877/m.73548 type:complete len:205 (+) Transcript_36877:764-1378(+)
MWSLQRPIAAVRGAPDVVEVRPKVACLSSTEEKHPVVKRGQLLEALARLPWSCRCEQVPLVSIGAHPHVIEDRAVPNRREESVRPAHQKQLVPEWLQCCRGACFPRSSWRDAVPSRTVGRFPYVVVPCRTVMATYQVELAFPGLGSMVRTWRPRCRIELLHPIETTIIRYPNVVEVVTVSMATKQVQVTVQQRKLRIGPLAPRC